MKLTLELPDGTKKDVLVDDSVDGVHLKQLCAQEAFTSPNHTRIYFGDKLLNGEQPVEFDGVTDGAVIKIVSASLGK
jgi:hypothetical protein